MCIEFTITVSFFFFLLGMACMAIAKSEHIRGAINRWARCVDLDERLDRRDMMTPLDAITARANRNKTDKNLLDAEYNTPSYWIPGLRDAVRFYWQYIAGIVSYHWQSRKQYKRRLKMLSIIPLHDLGEMSDMLRKKIDQQNREAERHATTGNS